MKTAIKNTLIVFGCFLILFMVMALGCENAGNRSGFSNFDPVGTLKEERERLKQSKCGESGDKYWAVGNASLDKMQAHRERCQNPEWKKKRPNCQFVEISNQKCVEARQAMFLSCERQACERRVPYENEKWFGIACRKANFSNLRQICTP